MKCELTVSYRQCNLLLVHNSGVEKNIFLHFWDQGYGMNDVLQNKIIYTNEPRNIWEMFR